MQVTGAIFVIFSIFTKIGAVFVTIPYPVVGGSMILVYGLVVGVALSNLQPVDLASTRNIAIVGMSLLIGLLTPYWLEKNPDGLKTGDSQIKSIKRAY